MFEGVSGMCLRVCLGVFEGVSGMCLRVCLECVWVYIWVICQALVNVSVHVKSVCGW